MLRFIVLLLLALATLEATAQGMPGRGRGGGGREMGSPRDRETRRDEPNIAARAFEPYGALERELPSLKVDLMIRGEQLDAWRVVERDVRDIAEMERARRRHLLALKGSEQSATALTFVSSLSEDDRVKAEAAADLKRHFEAFYAVLDERQRAILDRRVIQSQDEPLGSERPKQNR
jgi:hypothetical protein